MSEPEPATMRRMGPDRLRIDGLDDPERRRWVVDWLRERSDVVALDVAPGGESVDFRYVDPPQAPGRLVRALRDRIFSFVREPAPPPPLRVDVVHETYGRARFQLVGGEPIDVLRLCAWVGAQPDVLRATSSRATATVTVHFEPERTSAAKLAADATAAGVARWPPATPPHEGRELSKTVFNTLVLGATAAGLLAEPWSSVAVAATALPPARRALAALRHRRLTVDVLDVTAVAASLATAQPVTAAFMTWLLGVGDLALERVADRARSTIGRMADLDVVEAWRLRADGTPERVPAKKLGPGDRIVVYPGDRLPADGTVESGQASVDAKAITGESLPVDCGAGDSVLAASVVRDGQLVLRIDRVRGDTAAGKIVRILQGAGAKPMTLQQTTEAVANRLVLPTLVTGVAAAALTGQVDRFTSIAIADFGTGTRVSVPTTALVSMLLAARRGVLVKGAQYLERLAKADTIVFDKTGTLTRGEPEVSEMVMLNGMARREVLALVAAAEARQRHPIAAAIRRCAAREGVAVPDVAVGTEQYTIGMGLVAQVAGRQVLVGRGRMMRARGLSTSEAEAIRADHAQSGASSIFVAVDGRLEAVISYADAPRDESASVIDALRAGGRRQVMLMSGDARVPAEAIGRKLGVDRVLAELLPEDKANSVRALQAEGRTVAMVGDGINDAPALALADVGISLTGSTDVAVETADVVLLEGGLERLPGLFDLADDAMRRVRRGLGVVLVPNAVAVVLAALGLMPPGLAALLNNGSTLVAAGLAIAPLALER